MDFMKPLDTADFDSVLEITSANLKRALVAYLLTLVNEHLGTEAPPTTVINQAMNSSIEMGRRLERNQLDFSRKVRALVGEHADIKDLEPKVRELVVAEGDAIIAEV